MYFKANQIEKAMARYYQEFLTNPEMYEESFDNLDPEKDAKLVVEILVNFMMEDENQ